ncbi:MAG: hypothetical protein ACE15E_25240 [Acidobacteriota bacterium]
MSPLIPVTTNPHGVAVEAKKERDDEGCGQGACCDEPGSELRPSRNLLEEPAGEHEGHDRSAGDEEEADHVQRYRASESEDPGNEKSQG